MAEAEPVAHLDRTTLDGTVYVRLGGTLLVEEIELLLLAIETLRQLKRDARATVYPDRIEVTLMRPL